MSTAGDYQQAVRMLAKPLPAYVTYVQHAHAKMDAIVKDASEKVTVRTSDGKIVKGKGLEIVVGADKNTKGGSILKNSPFDPACYDAVSSRSTTFEGRNAEAITLSDHCTHNKDDGDFSTFFIDTETHDPIAVVGGKADPPVNVHIVERYVRAGDYILPGSIAVRVKGSGFMFWLDVDAHAAFTDYSFGDSLP